MHYIRILAFNLINNIIKVMANPEGKRLQPTH
jgi:hypothetical protein